MKISVATLFLISMALSGASEPPIHLKQGSFTPEKKPDTEFRAASNSVSNEGYKLLQFKEPTDRTYRSSLTDHLEFISYIPENAWIVKLNSGTDEIRSERKVRYLGPYNPGQKISPLVRGQEGTVDIKVSFFDSVDRPENILRKFGDIKSEWGEKTWILETKSSEVADIARVNRVKWIALKPPRLTTLNDDSRKVIGVEKIQKPPYNLTGEGLTAAIWDAGWAGSHNDLNYSLAWAGTSKTIRGDSGHTVDGHGTHVAGTMLGGGELENNLRGMAPDARLVTYEWPGNLDELYSETSDSSENYGAILSQNSWGLYVHNFCSLMGDYRSRSRGYDNITHGKADQEPVSVIFSAGNERLQYQDSNGNYYCGGQGYTFNTTTGPGGTAKNTITVGAVDDSADMTIYSSWGPTDDGRIKPTVVSDGGSFCSGINSTSPGNNYEGKCGTSMASPAVSGAAILLNKQFNRTYSRLPEPATVKATLIHTAEDLNRTGPDYVTGWGLVNTTEAVDYVNDSADKELIRRKQLSDKGDFSNFSVSVPEGKSLNFTLVWSDYPGTSGSGKALLNDLDLVVRNGEGDRKYPWSLSWENRTEPALQTREDHKNPVEQVSVDSSQTRRYTVVVNATKLPEGPQNYSLLMPDVSAKIPELDIKSPKNSNYTESPDFNISSTAELNDAVFSLDGSGNFSMKRKNLTYLYNISKKVSDGEHEAVFWANNTENYTVSENVSFSVDTESPELEVKEPAENANISGNFSLNATWSDSFAGVKSQEFTVSNSTYSSKGSLNSTFNSSKLEDGDYNITYNITDKFGNSNITVVSVTIDNEKPSLNYYSPEDGDAFKDDIKVRAAWGDDLTGIENQNFTLENSSFSTSKTLNDTVLSSELSEGSYNLTYSLEDRASNIQTEELEVFYDLSPPSLDVNGPKNSSFVKANFSVNATFEDSLSAVADANFTITNGTNLISGDLNQSLDTSNLSNSEYNITFRAFDDAGNKNSSRINVTLDSLSPNVTLESPNQGESLAGNLSINATYSDNFEVVDANYSLSNDSLQSSGNLNATLNSSIFSDGSYEIKANSSDKAGNIESSEITVEFDNTPPEIKNSTIAEYDNLSGDVNLNFTLKEATGVQMAEFRLTGETGNVTAWDQLNYTGLNTSNFSDGNYNLSLKLNDTLGNYQKTNFTTVEIDNTKPNLDLKEFNLSEEVNGWTKDNKTVQANCTDTGSGVENVSVGSESNDSTPANFTLDESGENSYSFGCTDKAGNSDFTTKEFSIDTDVPELISLSPSQGSETGRSPEIQGVIFDESEESGINTSQSTVETSSGTLDLSISNSTFNASLEDLEFSESYTLEGTLVDNVGHNHSFSASYSVKQEEDDSGGGGGGGGFTTTTNEGADGTEDNSSDPAGNETDTSDLFENTTETEGGEDNQTSSCEITAVKENQCQGFDECEAPEGWRKVETCESWRELRATDLVESLPEDGGQKVREARAELEDGNYSGAINKALEAKEAQKKSDSSETNLLEYLLLVAAGLLVFSLIIFRYYRRRKLLNKVEQSSGELLKQMKKRGDLSPDEERKLAEACDDIDEGSYKEAEKKLKDIKSQ